jgi:hypothetical protein
MKINRTQLLLFVAMVVIAAVCRAFDRPPGFAPQIAIALFGGIFFKNRAFSLLAPIASLLISDLLYHLLYISGKSAIPGFYQGQWINYILLTSVVFVGMLFRQKNWKSYIAAGIAGPTFYFLISNLQVWLSGGGFGFSRTFSGLIANYTVALPFYYNSLLATFFFGAILIGVYYASLQRQKVYQSQ